MEQILSRDSIAGNRSFSLSVLKEDLSSLYPGFFRYTLSVSDGIRTRAVFRTNTYEYAPGVPLHAEEVALQKAGEWERELQDDPDGFLSRNKPEPKRKTGYSHTDVVIVQGSPRPDGNCSILAVWAAEAVRSIGRTVQVMYPHDLDIHACIGCYQCYNTGTCTFDDDMGNIIDAIRHASLIIICSPVYTNSVPGDLKLLIDRCQAYHAELTITGQTVNGKQGLILSVAGRKGRTHFICITSVVKAFMRNVGINPAGELLIDGVDEVRDIGNNKNLKEDVRTLVERAFTLNN